MTDPTVTDEPPRRPVILFACVHNSGRSVAGAKLTQRRGGDRVVVRSAGSEPSDGVNPAVAQVLAERGIDTGDHIPTLLTYDGVVEADVVITMGCGEACRAVPGKRIVDWELEDPKGKDLGTVRRIVDEIDGRVSALLAELGLVLPRNA